MDSLNKWDWPDRGSEAEKKSLQMHAAAHLSGEEPDEDTLKGLLKDVVANYPSTWTPSVFYTSGGKWFISHQRLVSRINEILDNDVERDSTPGMPWNVLYSTNDQLIAKDKQALILNIVDRFYNLCGLDATCVDPVELVNRRLVDPVKVFIKNEPHSVTKRAAGQLRLICSVSIVDQVCERLLYSTQNKTEIRNWATIPSKPGMGLDDDSQAELWKYMHTRLGEAAETDVQHWDWSVQPWEMIFEAEARFALSGATCPLFRRALLNRAWCEMNTLFCLSDGTFWAQLKAGKRCSGSYNTSTGNSRMRWALTRLLGCEWAIAMGDDCVEQYKPGAKEFYERMGHHVKMYSKCDGKSFEFCSTKFENGVGTPVRWDRTFYRLLCHTEILSEFQSQFSYELRHSPHLARCKEILVHLTTS